MLQQVYSNEAVRQTFVLNDKLFWKDENSEQDF